MQLRLLTCALIAILLIAWQSIDARGGGMQRRIQSFDGIDELFAFEVEGVSLNTPAEDVAGILEANGYTLQQDNGIMRVFTKGVLGQGNVGVKGELGYVFQITITDNQHAIYFRRPGYKLTAMEQRAFKPGPVPDSIDVATGTALRDMVCANLGDAKERSQLCRRSEFQVGFGPNLTLVLRERPKVVVSADIQGHKGEIAITSYR